MNSFNDWSGTHSTPELEAQSLEYQDQVATRLAETINEYLAFATVSDLLNLISAQV